MGKILLYLFLCMVTSWAIFLTNWFTGYVKMGTSTETKSFADLVFALRNDFFSIISVPTLTGMFFFIVIWFKARSHKID